MSEQCEYMTDGVCGLQEENGELMECVKALEAENQQLHDRIVFYRADIRRLEGDCDAYSAQMQVDCKRIAELEAERDQFADQVQDMRSRPDPLYG